MALNAESCIDAAVKQDGLSTMRRITAAAFTHTNKDRCVCHCPFAASMEIELCKFRRSFSYLPLFHLISYYSLVHREKHINPINLHSWHRRQSYNIKLQFKKQLFLLLFCIMFTRPAIEYEIYQHQIEFESIQVVVNTRKVETQQQFAACHFQM